MKKFKFKDGQVITASSKEEAIQKHKVMAGTEQEYIATIKVGNFNTNHHYTKQVVFSSSGRENRIGDDLKTACNKEVGYNDVWWLISVEMQNQKKFFDSFN